MDIIVGRTFTAESVCLDGTHFIDCTLNSCLLSYSGGGVILERTAFNKCRHIFHGPARATVLYLQSIGMMESDAGEWTDSEESVN